MTPVPFNHNRLFACWLNGRQKYSAYPIAENVYRAPSASTDDIYTVTIIDLSYVCDCPAYLKPYRACGVGAVAAAKHNRHFLTMCYERAVFELALRFRARRLTFVEYEAQSTAIISEAYGEYVPERMAA